MLTVVAIGISKYWFNFFFGESNKIEVEFSETVFGMQNVFLLFTCTT